MKYLLLFFSFLTLSAAGQTTFRPGLKRELDSIYVVDQHYREMIMASLSRRGADSVAAVLGMTPPKAGEYLYKSMARTDSSNIRRVNQIITQYGYPGKSMVGVPANEAVFYVVQHSQFIKRHLPLIKQAVDKGELAFDLYAKMLDRQLMFDGREQIYGTQAIGVTVRNRTTGQPEFKYVIWPVQRPAGVNQRRKKAGFSTTVEENARQLGTTYEIRTLAEIKKLQNP